VLLPPQSLNLLCVIKKLQFNALRSFIDTACGRCKSIHIRTHIRTDIRIRPVAKQLQTSGKSQENQVEKMWNIVLVAKERGIIMKH